MLNTTYEPISVVTARRAVVLVITGKASVVAAGQVKWHSERTSVDVPSVVRLFRYVKVPYNRRISPTRRAVFARDGNRCQYCSKPADSIDHIVPRSRGGANDWTNVVACCRRCNVKKGDRLPAEARMDLARDPRPPFRFGWVYASAGPDVNPHWIEFLEAG